MMFHKFLCGNLQRGFSTLACHGQQNSIFRVSFLRNNAFKKITYRQGRGSRSQGRDKGLLPSTPFEGFSIETGPITLANLKKSAIFALAFSTGSFLACAILEYENIRAKIKHRKTFADVWTRKKLNQGKSEIRREFDLWWNKLSSGEKIFVPICILNVLVFGMWRVPALQPMMVKYFCSNPAARAVCWPMVLSTFSHYSLFHIFANMYVLHSFSNAAVSTLGKEQFLGLYLSAGVISSLGSYMYKAATSQVGLSLGASGAIMAILAFVCAEYPDTRLSILFLPMYTFAAGSAIKVIMGLDLAGCLMGWKFFDHAAHLSGASFGLFWCYVGQEYIWPKREHFLKVWNEIRSIS